MTAKHNQPLLQPRPWRSFQRGALTALLLAATQSPLLAQHLKSFALARLDWDRHAVPYTSNDSAIADNYKTNNSGNKWAHGYQFAQWTWVPGHEGSIGSFYSCGFAKARRWRADFKYKQQVSSFPSGAKGTQQPCLDNSSCDCECSSMVESSSIGTLGGTTTTLDPGSALMVQLTQIGPTGSRVSASLRLEAIENATGAVIDSGEIRLQYDPNSPTAPQLLRTGAFQNAQVALVPTPTGYSVDLSNVTYSMPYGPSTHSIELTGEAVGSEPDTELVLPEQMFFTHPSSSSVPWRNTDFRTQTIYDTTHFTDQGVTGPITIRGLRYRAADGAIDLGGAVYPAVDVHLSSSSADFSAPASTFSSNRGVDETLCYSGMVTTQPCEGDAPNDYVIEIEFTTPFVYDPTLGNDLLIEVAATAATGAIPLMATSNANGTERARRISAASTTAPTGAISSQASVCLIDFDGPGGITNWRRATSVDSGTGCYTTGRTAYESFLSGAAVDLANTTITLLPLGNGGYAVNTSTGSTIVPPVGTGLALGDDAVSTQTLPFNFPYPGGTTSTIGICSNGFAWLGAPPATLPADFSPTVGEMLGANPRLCPMWHDFRPDGATNVDNVFFEADPSGQAVQVTWRNVAAFSNPALHSTVQLVLHDSGVVEFVYGALQGGTGACIVGAGPGLGAADTGNRDFSVGGFQSGGPEQEPLRIAGSLPLLGSTVTHTIDRIPASALLSLRLLSFSSIPGVDLGMYGAPGCQLWVDSSAAVTDFVFGNPVANVSFNLPNHATFLGVVIHAQAASFVPGANALGLLTSNRNTLTIGNN
jgi:hypothetical protein